MKDMLARMFLRQRLITTRTVRIIMFLIVLLLLFHAAVIIGPLIACVCGKTQIQEWELEHLRFASESLAMITVTLIMVLVLWYIQSRLLDIGTLQREMLYEKIKQQLFEWFAETKTPLGEDETELIRRDVTIRSQLQHLKIKGSVQNIIEQWPEFEIHRPAIEEYCSKVHFEITSYPAELLYGLHFEFDFFELNSKLCTYAHELLALERQYSCLSIDTSVPKKPDWIFLTVKIDMKDDFQNDAPAPRMVTHARHFVELVGHSYDIIYSREMINKYLESKKEG